MVNTTTQFQNPSHMSSLKTFYSNKNHSKYNIDRWKISIGDMTPSLLLSPIHHFRHFHCETLFQSSKLIIKYQLLHPHLFWKNYMYKLNTSVSYIHRFLTVYFQHINTGIVLHIQHHMSSFRNWPCFHP